MKKWLLRRNLNALKKILVRLTKMTVLVVMRFFFQKNEDAVKKVQKSELRVGKLSISLLSVELLTSRKVWAN